MAELAKDPEYVRRRAERDKKFADRQRYYDSKMKPVLDELCTAGFPGTSVQDVTAKYAPLPEPAVGILIDFLNNCDEEALQNTLVRALGAAAAPFDGRLLTDLYDQTWSEALRFAILNTIAMAKPHSIDEWIEAARKDDYRRQKLTDLGFRWPKK